METAPLLTGLFLKKKEKERKEYQYICELIRILLKLSLGDPS